MVSAVVLTKNEEKNIGECLKNLKWCEEIVVVDDYSTDKTIGIIGGIREIRGKTKILQRKLDGDFAAQRNFGLEQAKGEWVLFVDADERISSALAAEISKFQAPSSNYQGFYIKRRDFLFGRWLEHGETAKVKLLRLAKKGAGEWVRPVHETWQIRGKVGQLANPLLHYPHQTIGEFLQDINFYTDLNAKVFYQQRVKVAGYQIMLYPLAKFIKNYFWKLGFLDGTAGILQATLMSFHSFLTRAKLYLLWQK